MDKLALKNQTIYQVYVRNYSAEGTFKAVEKDLPRIADLGVSIVYLLPIHPIGVVARKGALGSPYAIQDYKAINPELGTLADFQSLLQASHKRGLKVMMDIVFNHTARDAKWVKEHPDYYYYKDGKLANRVGDWSDVADLLITKPEVEKALIDVLLYWTKMGVDGFRCDVAPLLPIEFWIRARKAVSAVNPDMIWLSESVDPGFIQWLREENHTCMSDAQMYQAFDILYDYDVFHALEGYFTKKNDLKKYLTLAAAQSYIYPKDYLKIHHLENHDTARAAKYIRDMNILKNMTAWSFFQNGVGFVYAGQETLNTKTPSLFEKDTIDLKVQDSEFYQFIKKMIALKKHPAFASQTRLEILETIQPDLIEARLQSPHAHLYGIFNLAKGDREVYVPFADGTYSNWIDQAKLTVKDGILKVKGPVVVEAPKKI